MTGRRWATLRGGAWLVFLVLSLMGLHRLGSTMPATPPPGTSADVWLTDAGPVPWVVAVVRLVALGVGWYLLLSTLLLCTIRMLGWWRALAAVEVVVPRVVRRVVHGAIGFTLVAGPAPALAAPHRPASVVHSTSDVPPVIEEGERAGGAITMRRLPDALAGSPVPPPAPSAARTWTIAAGEHLWSIAERVLSEHLGRAPTDGEIDPYWRTLVEVNRPRLTRPDLPDLVFPGQVLEVPPPRVAGV